MELYEIIEIINGERKLVEMAFPIQQVRSELTNRPFQFNRYYHLILIYYFRNEQEFNHWVGELSGFIPRSVLVKGRNKRFSAEETFHYIWKGWVEDVSVERTHSIAFSNAKYAEETKRELEESKTKTKIASLPWNSINENPKDAFSFMEDFHKWAAEKLFENGEIKSNEVREIIPLLLDKHPLLEESNA